MPNAGDKVELSIEMNASSFTYVGIFAGYDDVTENYIIEDCYWTKSQEDHQCKMFFNRKYVIMIELFDN